jgi:hypothetical protein
MRAACSVLAAVVLLTAAGCPSDSEDGCGESCAAGNGTVRTAAGSSAGGECTPLKATHTTCEGQDIVRHCSASSSAVSSTCDDARCVKFDWGDESLGCFPIGSIGAECRCACTEGESRCLEWEGEQNVDYCESGFWHREPCRNQCAGKVRGCGMKPDGKTGCLCE